MKRAKHLSSISKKLTSVPELPYKKGLLNSLPKAKEKRNAKTLHDKIEPMVLRSPPTGESIVRYALPIPSSKTKELIAEDEMIRRIAKHLKTVVCTLEDTYGAVDEDIERTGLKPKQEGSASLSVGDDMNAFLLCCSQLAAQLEEAVKEERNILESLFKWFQQQVNQMEEISKDQSILEAELPSDDKSVHLNMALIVRLMQKLEELRSRLRERRGLSVLKHTDKETLQGTGKSYEGLEKQIEDFIKSHSTYESQIISETEPEAPYSVTNRVKLMIKIFENQANMLERVLNDQSINETKYKQMETDFQVLLLEKNLLESEIRKIRESEKAKPTSKEERAKKSARAEKKKDKDQEGKLSPSKEIELLQMQKETEFLKMEKKALQEQLKWALQEAERNKTQLDHVLHQEMEMLKEDRSKTRLERGFSKTRVKSEDSRYSLPAEKDAQSGGQRQDHDQVREKLTEVVSIESTISPEKSKRLVDESLEKRRSISAVVESSNLEGFYGVSDVQASLPEIFKSFTALPLIEEHLESTSPQGKETEMWSLVSFPSLTEEIEKAEASEQILSHTEAENPEDESSAPEDRDLLPEDEAPSVKQLTEQGRRKPLYITTKTPELLSLISRTQSEIENREAIKYENLTNEYEEQYGKEDSKAEIKLKRQKAHAEDSDKVVYKESTKAKIPAKKRNAAKGKGLIPPDADADGSLSPLSQGSVSKVDTQTKKQRIHKRERTSASNETPDNVFEHQDSGLKSEVQAKKLKIFKSENIPTEASDRNIRLEDQNVQSSSQVQLKKQKSTGGDIFTIHFAEPDESNAQLHQESSPEARAEVERGTASEDWRFSKIPLEYQRRELSVDNLLPEKKPLIITMSSTQSKRYLPSWDDNAGSNNVDENFTNEDLTLQIMDEKSLGAQNKPFTEIQKISEHQKELNPIISDIIFRLDMDRVLENDIEHLKETFGQHLLKSEFKTRSKSGFDVSTDRKEMPEKSKLKEPVETELKSKQNSELSTIKGMKLFEKPKNQHDMSLSTKEDISTVVSSLKTKPQENINVKYHPLKKFPTKVVNLSPFIVQDEDMETSSPYANVIPKPFYRTSRGSSVASATIHQLLNIKALGNMKSNNENKQNTELENQLHIPTTSLKKYVHKGQSKQGKLKKRGAEPQSNMRPPSSSIKKQKLKEQAKPVKSGKRGVEFPNVLKKSGSTPKIKVIKELSKTSNLDEDTQLSNVLPKSKSAAKNPEIKEQPDSVNLNDDNAIILYNLHGSTSPTSKDLVKELSKTTHFYEVSQHSSVMLVSTSARRKPRSKETSTILNKKGAEVSSNLQMSNLVVTVNTLKEPSKHSNLDKKATEDKDFLHMSASALIKYFLKESSKTSNLEKKRSKASNSLHKSTSPERKRVRKEPSKTKKLGKNVADGTHLSTTAKKKPRLKAPAKTSNLNKQIVKGPNSLPKSASASKKQESKDLPKPTNLNDAQLLSSLHISTSDIIKKVLKGQPKPILDKKGVDLSNNLVPSSSAFSKHGLKGKPKSANR